MKIGILTFQFAYNYGAILQCVALYRVIKGLGHDVEVIDYRPYPEPSFGLLRGWGLCSGHIIKHAKIRFNSGIMKKKCDDFMRSNVSLSPTCTTIDQLAEIGRRYSAIITGSDQVWNRNYHNGPEYFLGWEPPYDGKRISYAPSCGTINQPLGGQEAVRNWLTRFDALSVRDRVSHDVVTDLCGRSPVIVSDPTLLCDFDGRGDQSVPLQGKYIFMYVLGDEISGGHDAVLRLIRLHHGNLPVVQIIPTAHKTVVYEGADRHIWSAGPDNWLQFLAHSKFVYTDSFHAVIFSMKFGLPFLVYYAESLRAPRLRDLAQRYQVAHAVVGSVEDAQRKRSCEIQYDAAILDKIFRIDKETSVKFIQQALAS